MRVPEAVRKMGKLFGMAKKERETGHELHGQVQARVRRLEREAPEFHRRLENAYGYVVFPSVGKASAVLGGAYGLGEVFERGRLIGYAGIIELTLGVQLGGQTFAELVIFEDSAALERFKQGKVHFAANASAAAVKAGVAATNDLPGMQVLLFSDGGFNLETALGGQEFFFKGAALTRGKKLDHAEAGGAQA